MKKERKEKHFIQKPTYPGGQNALKKFITSQLKYPKKALKDKTEGTVFLRYDINYKGEVVETHILSSLSKACDAEADRLVRLLKFEVPKTRKVKVLFIKRFKFILNYQKQKKRQLPINTPLQLYRRKKNLKKLLRRLIPIRFK